MVNSAAVSCSPSLPKVIKVFGIVAGMRVWGQNESSAGVPVIYMGQIRLALNLTGAKMVGTMATEPKCSHMRSGCTGKYACVLHVYWSKNKLINSKDLNCPG